MNVEFIGVMLDVEERVFSIELKEGSTIADLLNEIFLKKKSLKDSLIDPSTGCIHSYIRILLNGRDITFLNGTATMLSNGDVVTIFPVVGGG